MSHPMFWGHRGETLLRLAYHPIILTTDIPILEGGEAPVVFIDHSHPAVIVPVPHNYRASNADLAP